jgi:hypothetical protein
MDQVRFNNNLVGWGSLIFLVEITPQFGGGGQRFFGFNSFNTGDEARERELIYGQDPSQSPMGKSPGEYNPGEPKIRWLVHAAVAQPGAGFDSLVTLLSRAAPDGISYGDVTMNWTLQLSEGPLAALYEWDNVTVKGKTGAWERGPAGLYEEWSYQCDRQRVNGKTLYRSFQP